MGLLDKISRTPLAPLLFTIFDGFEIGRRYGTVPYFPVSSDKYDKREREKPRPFDLERPEGLPRDVPWDTDEPFPQLMNSIVSIPHGSADTLGFVFNERGRPVSGAIHTQRQMRKYRWRLRRDGISAPYMREMAKPEHFAGKVFAVTGSDQHFFYHWLFDVLPRLQLAIEEIGPDDRIYIQTKAHKFQEETLAYFSEFQDRFIDANEHPWIKADELVVPCHQILNGYHYFDWVLSLLRERFPPSPQIADLGEKRRLYISRAAAKNRRLLNEDEIFAILEPLGFELIVSEQRPFQEQVDMFASAEAVISPHGAGLSNLVFCEPGTKVVELFPTGSVDAYHRLSVGMGHAYAYTKTDVERSNRRANEDFTIDPAHFQMVLESIGIAPRNGS